MTTPTQKPISKNASVQQRQRAQLHGGRERRERVCRPRDDAARDEALLRRQRRVDHVEARDHRRGRVPDGQDRDAVEEDAAVVAEHRAHRQNERAQPKERARDQRDQAAHALGELVTAYALVVRRLRLVNDRAVVSGLYLRTRSSSAIFILMSFDTTTDRGTGAPAAALCTMASVPAALSERDHRHSLFGRRRRAQHRAVHNDRARPGRPRPPQRRARRGARHAHRPLHLVEAAPADGQAPPPEARRGGRASIQRHRRDAQPATAAEVARGACGRRGALERASCAT